MDFKTRLLRYVPAFLKRKAAGEVENIATGAAAGLEELQDDVQVLRAQGAANRFSGEFATYYASEQRKDDVARLGMSRKLSKRSNESWTAFEERVRALLGSEDWLAGECQRFTVTGDVAQWGCYTGIEREIERTGLVVSSIIAAIEDTVRWRVLTVVTMGGVRDADFSMILSVGTAKPPNQRLTKIYGAAWEGVWIIWITLTNPSVVEYSEDEVLNIVKLTKPAWVRAYVRFPSATYWKVVN